jgi:dihydrofolate reductase
MAKIVVSEFVSLDGVMEDPGGAEKFEFGGWTMPYWNDDVAKFKYDELFAADALLLGRVTYQAFAAAWPSMKDEFADRMNNMTKYVVSSTLDSVEWTNSQLLTGDLVTAVTALHEQPGGDILIAGSATLVQALLRHNLVDDLRLEVYPVVLGTGQRLFDGAGHTTWTLGQNVSTSTGVSLQAYHRA